MLAWHAEFDGDTLDRTKWDLEHGNGFDGHRLQPSVGGWGRAEPQYDTGEPERAQVRDSCVFIRALKVPSHGCGPN